MGTHGRNAITRDGKHVCHEQSMDGHCAANDFTDPFLKEGRIPQFDEPTMKDQTDECDHYLFSHIDYDRKILYTSWEHPLKLLQMGVRGCGEYLGFDKYNFTRVYRMACQHLINLYKIEQIGWKIIFDVTDCPRTYRCRSSRWDVSVRDLQQHYLPVTPGDIKQYDRYFSKLDVALNVIEVDTR